MFNKTTLVLAFSTLVCATSAYAIVSARTPLVVGFKPVFTNKTGKGAVTGSLNLGGTMSVKKQDIANILGFTDRDGDKPDEANFKYSWAVEGNVLSTTTTVTIPNDMTLIGKRLVLTITPISISGEPLTGDPLVLDNLNQAGASGGQGDGKIGLFQNNLIAGVSDISFAGALEVGKDLTATYKFRLEKLGGAGAIGNIDSVVQLVEDHSIFVWGNRNTPFGTLSLADALASRKVDRSDPNVVKVSGQVPAYTIRSSDVGEVIELTIYPRTQNISNYVMPLGVHNYEMWHLESSSREKARTVSTNGSVQHGNTTPNIAGLIDPNKDGKVTWKLAEPKVVRVTFSSSATKALNGVDGMRPVAAKDVLSATFTPADHASDKARDYTFQWKADGKNIGTAEIGKDTFTPGPEYQGKVISVDVLPVKKVVP